MSYAAAIEQLNAMVPELYTGSGQPRRKFSLDEIRLLLAALGDPHRRFDSHRFRTAHRALHIAAPGAGE